MDDQEVQIESENRAYPMVHQPIDLHICPECLRKDGESLSFDPCCDSCMNFLNTTASVNDMFAILRVWIPEVQQIVGKVIGQMLDCGAHVNDRDGLTDMTMLHYAVKSGTRGMGSMEEACKTASMLLSRGADPYIRCRWTNMAAIHYATYFDVHKVLELLLDATKDVDVDSMCCDFDNGAPLHIACRTLSLNSSKVLLKHGANKTIKDGNGKTPIDLLPDLQTIAMDIETFEIVKELKHVIDKAPSISHDSNNFFSHNTRERLQTSNVLKSLGLKIGEKVFVGGIKTGILRYCGPTLFANGFWAGIELDEAVGKNDGSINNIQYFRCPPNYGIFAPLSKISRQPSSLPHGTLNGSVTHSRLNLTHITAKINSGLRQSKMELDLVNDRVAEIGDKVLIAGKRVGTVRYIGDTEFSPGCWYGVELTKPVGKNDGSVDGVKYFDCSVNHGVFAPPSRVQRIEKENDLRTDKMDLNRAYKHSASEILNGENFLKPNTSKSRMLNLKAPSASNCSEPVLSEGTHVFCNGEIGVVHYMGPVSFAEGIWLGVELRTPKGKHDGLIQGKRYFTCKPGHGLLVRPSKVYVRGINGSKLITAN